jgi:hypothetical protein
MKRRDPGLEPELEAFLKHRTVERRVPSEIRTRSLARARASLGARPAISFPVSPHEAPLLAPVASGNRRLRIALAASVAVACIAVGAVAALRAGRAPAPRAISLESPPRGPNIPVTSAGSPARETTTADTKPRPAANPPHPARTGAKADPFTAELELLQRAHSAYTRREFSIALALVTEHARRFPRGRLAEQREALRVRSLLRSGHADEAHRAAAAFAVRFPRSVLLSRVEGSPESSEP